MIPVTNRPLLQVALLNICSACNKATFLCEYVKDNHLDIFSLTETWLKTDDQHVVAELTPHGYIIQYIPHPVGRGGVVAILHKESMKVSQSDGPIYKSF